MLGGHTAVDKVVDLLFGHSRPFGSAESPLLFLSPVVDEVSILGVAGVVSLARRTGEDACIHMNQGIELTAAN